MRIGLLFGSFNPIHIGHLSIANYMLAHSDLKQIWLVVSPHNPLKLKSTLADDKSRLAGVKKAVGKNSKIKVSDIELSLPQPSYTINTLKTLRKKYTQHNFVVIIGSDNLSRFHKWKDYKWILNSFEIYVYPRPGSRGGKLVNHASVKMFDAPQVEISSTFIRAQIKKGKNIKHLIPGSKK